MGFLRLSVNYEHYHWISEAYFEIRHQNYLVRERCLYPESILNFKSQLGQKTEHYGDTNLMSHMILEDIKNPQTPLAWACVQSYDAVYHQLFCFLSPLPQELYEHEDLAGSIIGQLVSGLFIVSRSDFINLSFVGKIPQKIEDIAFFRDKTFIKKNIWHLKGPSQVVDLVQRDALTSHSLWIIERSSWWQSDAGVRGKKSLKGLENYQQHVRQKKQIYKKKPFNRSSNQRPLLWRLLFPWR